MSAGPFSENFKKILSASRSNVSNFSCCFSLKTHEKTLDIEICDENQAKIWLIGLRRILRSQNILPINKRFYINQPFSFHKLLSNILQKSYEFGMGIRDLIFSPKNTYKNGTKIDPQQRYNQRDSIQKYKYLSLGGLNNKKENSKTLKSIESYINPLNESIKNEKIIRRSQTERNFLSKPHNSLPRNLKACPYEEKENQDSYNYQPHNSINYGKKPQKTKIKLSFDKSTLKQKVLALINKSNRSFATQHDEKVNESFANFKEDINKTSIENLTIEIANIDLISPQKNSNQNQLDFTRTAGVSHEDFDDLNVFY